MLYGALAALGAGLLFAFGGVAQQRAAASRPSKESLSPKLIWSLAHDRLWLTGIAVATGSYALQALALALAPLAVVQPVLVSEVLFAIPISVKLHGCHLRVREWAGVGLVVAGLALAIVSAYPREGSPLVAGTKWLPYLIGIAAATAVVILVGRRVGGTARASLFALAAALVMGVEAAAMSATAHLFEISPLTMFTSWQPYVMAVASLTEMMLLQSAFQAGPLAASMPVADSVEPLVAIGLGLVLFGERVRTAPLALAGATGGIALLLTGVVLLDTSPVVHRLHRDEQRQRDEERAPGEPENRRRAQIA